MIMRLPNEIKRNEYLLWGVVNIYNQINFFQNPIYQNSNYEDDIEKSKSPKTIIVGESP